MTIDRGVVDARWSHGVVAESPGGVDHPSSCPDDHGVGGPEVLLRAVVDRPHALRDGLILLVDAGDAGEALGALRLTVDEVVVVLVLGEPELAEPVRRIRQELEAAGPGAGRRDRSAAGVEPGRAARSPRAQARAGRGNTPEHDVLVVDGHPGADEDLRPEDAGRDHREEREQEVGDAPVVGVCLGRAVGAVGGAELGVDDLVLRGAVGHVVVVERPRGRLLGLDGAQVEEPEMARVDVALEPLEPVALAQDLLHGVLAPGQHVRLDVRQRRRRLARPHVGPDDVVALDARVRGRVDLRLEVALLRFAGHVDAVAFAAVLPAVVDAAQAFFLVATEEERGAAVRTMVLDEPDLAGRDAKGDQVLAHEPDADGRTVPLRQLARHEGGHPVLAQHRAHRRAGSDATEQLVVFPGKHRLPPLTTPLVRNPTTSGSARQAQKSCNVNTIPAHRLVSWTGRSSPTSSCRPWRSPWASSRCSTAWSSRCHRGGAPSAWAARTAPITRSRRSTRGWPRRTASRATS